MRFEGKTVDDAIAKACLKLEKTLKELSIKTISKGKKGFLGIGSKPEIIDVTIIDENNSKKVDNGKNVKDIKKENIEKIKTECSNKKEIKKEVFNNILKEQKIEALKEVNIDNQEDNNVVFKDNCEANSNYEIKAMHSDIMEVVEKYILELLTKMNIEDAKLTFELDEEKKNININISSQKSSLIIGKRGSVLDSIQVILNVVFSDKRGEYWIKLDIDDYRIKRQKTIEALAIRSAMTVKKYKRKVILDNLNANERRIIHSILQKDSRVDTFSEGREPYRKLIIALKRNKYN